jgi:hypothetical protein
MMMLVGRSLGSETSAFDIACAAETVHAASLFSDDLPLRFGQRPHAARPASSACPL